LHERVEEPDGPRSRLLGDMVQVRPVAGETFTDRATEPVNPLTLVAVNTELPALPELIVTPVGLAPKVKSCMMKVKTPEWDNERLVAVTVTLYVVAEPVHESVEVPVVPSVMVVGARVQLMPVVGVVEETRLTVPENPLIGFTVTVEVPVVPALTVIVAGDGRVRLKS
jgi:hypothetical protein